MTKDIKLGKPSADSESQLTSPHFHHDGWDSAIRFGAVVPHADVGPECELGAMGTPHVSVHASRLYFSAMRAGGEMDEKIPHAPVASFAEPPYVDDIVESLAASPLDVIALAFTSSAYTHGPEGEQKLVERLAPRARNIPITTTCLAAAAAFSELRSERIALINPPWFDNALDQAGADYFSTQGFNIVHHGPCGLPSGQKFITPRGLYDWVTEIAHEHRPDTIMIAGNGQRAVGIINAVEHDLGITLLTSNQLILWHGLKLSNHAPSIENYGRIFRML